MASLEQLRNCHHLADLSEATLQELAGLGQDSSSSLNDTLFTDMDPAENLYLVLAGKVNLCCELGTGEMRTMDTVTDGELFAWSALVEPYRYTSTAVAAQDTQLVLFDAAKLRQCCRDNPQFGNEMLRKVVALLSERLEAVRGRLTGR